MADQEAIETRWICISLKRASKRDGLVLAISERDLWFVQEREELPFDLLACWNYGYPL
jgi:hypothetical protein